MTTQAIIPQTSTVEVLPEPRPDVVLSCRHDDIRSFDAAEADFERLLVCADCHAVLLHTMVVPGSEP